MLYIVEKKKILSLKGLADESRNKFPPYSKDCEIP